VEGGILYLYVFIVPMEMKCTCWQFFLKLTCFISLFTTSCSRCGGLVIETLEQNVSDVYNINRSSIK
jgi:hypothetical protein